MRWGVRPMWPCTGMPARTIARMVGTKALPPSSLTASMPRLGQEAAGVADRFGLVRLVAQERQVADQERRSARRG